MKTFALPLGRVVAVQRANDTRKDTLRFMVFLRTFRGFRWKIDIEFSAWLVVQEAKKGEPLVEVGRRLAIEYGMHKLAEQFQ